MTIQSGQTFFHNCKGMRRGRQAPTTPWEHCGQTLAPHYAKCPSCHARRAEAFEPVSVLAGHKLEVQS